MGIEIELYDSKTAKRTEDKSPDILGRDERLVWESFRVPKRRNDWIAGRIAAKRLVQRFLADSGTWLSLRDIQIRNHESGEPYVSLPKIYSAANFFPISISHSNGLAACALGRRDARVGLDLEKIEVRGKPWFELMAHETERASELAADPVFQTLLWTLKESVMKVLGIGATVDFWDIRFPSLAQHVARTAKGFEIRTDFDAVAPELYDKALRAWEGLGRQSITHKTTILPSDQFVLTVAYTNPSRGGSVNGN